MDGICVLSLAGSSSSPGMSEDCHSTPFFYAGNLALMSFGLPIALVINSKSF
jgi:hypothetical protein